MTREEAKEMLPVIQAFAEGKAIQFKIEGFTDWTNVDTINLESNSKRGKYRIQPEPKYRPFKNQEECWQEMQKHQPFGWIKRNDKYVNITLVSGGCSYDKHFETVTFADGAPFGIKEE